MNVLLITAHSIAAYDDVRMLTDLGYDVFNMDGYIDPAAPHVDMRPALPNAPRHPELMAVVDGLGTKDNLTAAKERIPDALLEWADVAIFHHYLDRWMVPNFTRMKAAGVRVIWRTCGQSDFTLEDRMGWFRAQGMTVVRYSPSEQRFFAGAGHWAGQDALIRFGKYPGDYPAWTGPEANVGAFVANVTQDMAGRGEHCGLTFWIRATAGMTALPAGKDSEKLPGGVGFLPEADMLDYLRRAAAYLYVGTVPASYTLGLIEALMVGVPVVSIGPGAWMGPDRLFEGHELAGASFDRPEDARAALLELVRNPDAAAELSAESLRLSRLFDVGPIGQQWVDLLGAP